MKLYVFRTVPLSTIRSFSLYTQQWCMSYSFADSLRAGSGRNFLILFASCQQTCMTYTIAVCTVKTPDDEQRNCPKHVEFRSKNKFDKLVHLVGFVIRIILISMSLLKYSYTYISCLWFSCVFSSFLCEIF